MFTLNKQFKNTYISGIFHYIKPYKLQFLFVFMALIVTSSCVLAISYIIKRFIDTGITSNNVDMLNHSLFYLFAVILLLSIFTFIRFTLITYVGESIVARIRFDIFKNTLDLSSEFFERSKSGQVISYLTSDATLLLNVLSSSLSFATRNLVTIIGGVIIMFTINLKLSTMIVLLIPSVILPLVLLGRKLKYLITKGQENIGDLTFLLEQALGYIKTIQSYNAEKLQMNNFQQKNNSYLSFTKYRVIFRGLLTFMMISFTFGGIGCILWIGGHMVLNGEISAGDFSAFIYIAIVCAGAVGAITDFLGELQRASGAAGRIFEFLNTKPQISTSQNPTLQSEFKGNIKFVDVSFTYPTSSRKVLTDISFEIKPGERVALIGKSGAGKSTIFSLLERFYDVGAGKILLDGCNTKELPLEVLRKQFTYITQESAVFATSIYENILYGNPDASFEQVKKAAELASCLEFIEQLPQGFETDLGEKGMKLSGGQRQRISIARAILNNPKILLLDEATSSLDAENEHLIFDALHNLMKGRTTIIISHNFKFIKNVDKIIVFDRGKISQIGTYSELMKNIKGIFYKLSLMQNKGDDSK